MTKHSALCTLEVRGVPHEPFPERLILAVEDAIRLAWDRLQRRVPHLKLVEAAEPQITSEMRVILEEMRRQEPPLAFNDTNFGPVIVAGEIENHDGEKIDDKPDLVFYTRDRRLGIHLTTYDAIFVECKLIGQGRTVSDYAIDGITKFINGEYAWAMPHAMMVAYVRDGQRLPQVLGDNLLLHRGKNLLRYQVVSPPVIAKCKRSNKRPFVYITKHQRTWLHRDGSKPGDIEVRHLWLYLENSK